MELSSERQRQIRDEELERLAEEEYRSKIRVELSSNRSQSIPTKEPRYTHPLRRALMIAFLVIVIIYVLRHVLVPAQEHSTPRAGSSPSILRPFSTPLLLGSVAVQAFQYRYWKFEITQTMVNARVIGTFHASGGFGSDIEAVVAEWGQCENWLNGHQARVLYASGNVTNGTLDAPIGQAGTYCLAFSNKRALLSPKTVSGDIALRYLVP